MPGTGRASGRPVWLRLSGERRQGKLRSEEEKALGLSPLSDGGHGNFVLRSDLMFTWVTLAAGRKTGCRERMPRSRARLDTFPGILPSDGSPAEVAPADKQESRNFFWGLERLPPLASDKLLTIAFSTESALCLRLAPPR